MIGGYSGLPSPPSMAAEITLDVRQAWAFGTGALRDRGRASRPSSVCGDFVLNAALNDDRVSFSDTNESVSSCRRNIFLNDIKWLCMWLAAIAARFCMSGGFPIDLGTRLTIAIRDPYTWLPLMNSAAAKRIWWSASIIWAMSSSKARCCVKKVLLSSADTPILSFVRFDVRNVPRYSESCVQCIRLCGLESMSRTRPESSAFLPGIRPFSRAHTTKRSSALFGW
jgi:hypothetical protein